MPDSNGDYSSLEILVDYECPECGPVIEDPNDPMFTEDQATAILGGDENGFLRCPNDWCDEELEQTAEAALANLAWLAQKMPELAPSIADQVGRTTPS